MTGSNTDFISKSGEEFPWKNVRLPSFVSPFEYTLHLQPDLVSFKNTANVKISFTVLSETDFVVLHSKDLILTETKLLNSNKSEILIEKILEYPNYEQVFIKTKEILKPGNDYVLCIDFKSELKEKFEGFYISSYETSDGQKKYLATTHFEPTHARSAFPCFDEPAMKSIFHLTIAHTSEYNVYSNTEIKQSSPLEDGLILTEFEKTVKMSTYLVAFVICDFNELECVSTSGVKIRVIAPAEQVHQAEFALTCASNILPFFEEFFGIKYPLSKLDMIGIPDFSSGAMENWGLITYRMVNILINPEETSCGRQQHAAMTISHELAHQWFGNLVTMEWWNDLWLNEGFARFVQYLGVNHVFPEWNVLDQFIEAVTQSALILDSLKTSHPIMTDVVDPFDIESIFDSISYTKGASILHMLQDTIGLDTLKKGLGYYLNKYRFQNAKTEDLWNALTMVTKDLNVAEVMDTWTLQKGYPLIYVNYNDGLVKIRQTRFLLSSPSENTESESNDKSPFDYKWHIPVSYITNKDGSKKTFWLNTTEGEFSVSPEISWLKLNVNQTGFYRVMYDENMWKQLIKQMLTDHTVFSPGDRASLLDDAFVFARVGILKNDLAMDLTKYLEKESDYVPWETAISQFDYFFSMLKESPALPLMEKYILKLVKPIMKSLGWKDEGNHLTKKLRATIIRSAIELNDEDTIREIKETFNRWMNNGENVPPNLRHAVYFGGIKYGDEEEWNFCWKKYEETQNAVEKRLLLSALGKTQNHWQLIQYLNYSLDKNKIKPQDMGFVIAFGSLNPIGYLLTWKFIRMHWPQILELHEHSFAMRTIISYSISNFNTQFDYDEVKSFFSSVKTGSGVRSVQQGLEKIQTNIQWKEKNESSIIEWLKCNVSNL